MWNKKFNECLSCGTTNWSHKAKGYCKKCYPIINNISKVKVWDEKDSATWKEIPSFGKKEINVIKGDKFSSAKNEIIRQLESRLRVIKNTVNPEKVTAIQIEYTLDILAEIVLKNKGKQMFHGHASSYELFTDAHLKTIYKDLNSILLNKRFTLDLNKIFFNLNAN